MANDINKRLPAAADKKRLISAQEQDGRKLLKNISTLDEYYDLTNSSGHSADDPQDHTNAEEPQDKDKRFHKPNKPKQ